MMMRWCKAFFVFWLLLLQAGAQTTMKVKVNVVNVNAIVKDEANRAVAGLNAEDFVLEEDGRTQRIKYFSRESERPLALGLLVDMSGSMYENRAQQIEASGVFLESMLKSQDEAFIVGFSSEVEVMQSPSSSLSKLRSGLKELSHTGERYMRAISSRKCAGFSTTPLYDAIEEGSYQLRNTRGKRKALIVLTNGFDVNSCINLKTVIENALQEETIVYVVLYPPQAKAAASNRGLEAMKGASNRAREAMNKIAYFTGGDVYDVAEAPIEAIYRTIGEELRQVYSLGYSSDKPVQKKEYRQIRVRIQRPGATVVARDGYFVDPGKN